MSTPKRKRQSISIDLKKKIIDEQETHPRKSYADFAKQFSDKKTKLTNENIKRIFRDKEKILEAIDEGAGAKRKRLRAAKDTELEAAVLTWFKQVRSQNVAVTGPFLKVILDFIMNLTILFRKKHWSWLKNWKLKALKRAIIGWRISKNAMESSFALNKEKLRQLIKKS